MREPRLRPEERAHIVAPAMEKDLSAAGGVRMISLLEYQGRVTAIYLVADERGDVYPVLALSREAAELKEAVDKLDREPSEKAMDAVIGEAGDLLWHVAALCREFSWSMGGLAPTNVFPCSLVVAANSIQVVVGRVAEITKRVVIDKNGVFSAEDKHKIRDALARVVHLVAVIALSLGTSLNQVMVVSLAKLESRRVLGGSGDGL